MKSCQQGLRFSITYGRIGCGAWKQIFYGEFDGKRDKRAPVKIGGE
jgi:thiamine phosphate synthase YjbQ (UPF0047 family)